MADVGPQHANPLQENVFLVGGAPRDIDGIPALHHPLAPPSPNLRPIPVHAGVQQNAMFPLVNDAGDRHQPDDRWEVMPAPFENENIAAQGQPQDLRNNDIGYYGMCQCPPHFVAPHEYHDHGINYYARVAQGIPAQVQGIAPQVPGLDIPDYADHHAAAGLAQPLLNEWPHQVPIPNEPAAEVLRRVARHYLNRPDSQVGMVRMEPGPAGDIRVVITLEFANFL